MSDGNDVVYWFDGVHWTHGAAPVPECPGPPVSGGVVYCGPNAWWISEAGTEGQVLVSHGVDAPGWATAPVAPLDLSIFNPPWIPVTLINGWTNYGLGYDTAAYRWHVDGTGEIKGVIKGGTKGVAAFVLPFGPALQVSRLVLAGPLVATAAGGARVDVGKSGSVFVQSYLSPGSNSSVSLGGIRFQVAV